MERENFFWLALLIVLWWVSIWGFVETLLHMVIRGSPQTALIVYGLLFFVVALILYKSPRLQEHFI